MFLSEKREMSILVSTENSSTVYLSMFKDLVIPNTVKDPRPYSETLQIYIAKKKNNLQTRESIKEHKETVLQCTAQYDFCCCLNCYVLLPGQKSRCKCCQQPYCQACSAILVTDVCCPACQKNWAYEQMHGAFM